MNGDNGEELEKIEQELNEFKRNIVVAVSQLVHQKNELQKAIDEFSQKARTLTTICATGEPSSIDSEHNRNIVRGACSTYPKRQLKQWVGIYLLHGLNLCINTYLRVRNLLRD